MNSKFVPGSRNKLPAKLGQINFLWREKLVSQCWLIYVPDKQFTKIGLVFSRFWTAWLRDGYWVPGVPSCVWVFPNQMAILAVGCDLICHPFLSVFMHPVSWQKELLKQLKLKQTQCFFLYSWRRQINYIRKLNLA